MHMCRGNKNLKERVSTNLTYNSFEIERNFRCNKNYNKKMNPDYDIVVNRVHLYYDIKLVTFSIDRDKNLIIQFPVFIPAICTTATSTVSDRNITSSNHRPECTGRLLHAFTVGQAIHYTKL